MHGPDANFWDDLEAKIIECIRNTLDRRIQFYEEEIRKLSEMRFMPVWNFCNFFILKVKLVSIFTGRRRQWFKSTAYPLLSAHKRNWGCLLVFRSSAASVRKFKLYSITILKSCSALLVSPLNIVKRLIVSGSNGSLDQYLPFLFPLGQMTEKKLDNPV